jgi:hypothetical protein
MSKRSLLSRVSTGLITQEAKRNSRANFTAMVSRRGQVERLAYISKFIEEAKIWDW